MDKVWQWFQLLILSTSKLSRFFSGSSCKSPEFHSDWIKLSHLASLSWLLLPRECCYYNWLGLNHCFIPSVNDETDLPNMDEREGDEGDAKRGSGREGEREVDLKFTLASFGNSAWCLLKHFEYSKKNLTLHPWCKTEKLDLSLSNVGNLE